MHAFATQQPGMAGAPAVHQAAAAPAMAEGAEVLVSAVALAGAAHQSVPDGLMDVLAACLTVLLVAAVALAGPVHRPGPLEWASARAPVHWASARRDPRLAPPPVLRI